MKTIFVRCLEDGHPGYTKGKLYKVLYGRTFDDQGDERAIPIDDDGDPMYGWQDWMTRVDEEGQPVRTVKTDENNTLAVACRYDHQRAQMAVKLVLEHVSDQQVYTAAKECLLAYLRGK
jgi:hypothetical protein